MMKILLSVSFVLFLMVSGCETSTSEIEMTIYFDSAGGNEVSPITIERDATLRMPDNPTKEGYSFDGWYWDEGTYEDPFTAKSIMDAPLSSTMTVYAQWETVPDEEDSLDDHDDDNDEGELHTVTFDSKGGPEVSTKKIWTGQQLDHFELFKEGYSLLGWYLSNDGGETLTEPWDFRNPIKEDMTLYAWWVEEDISSTTLIINYYRFDDDFSQFDSVWLWPNEPDSGAGNQYFWEEQGELGQRLTIDLSETNLENSTQIGIIVRDDDWNKDPDQDRHIDMSQSENGIVEIYLIQDDHQVYYDIEDTPINE